MKHKKYSPDYVSRLEARLHEKKILAICDFSLGPWWGFNGVKTVAVTPSYLYVLQSGLAMTASSDVAKTSIESVPLDGIDSLSWKYRRWLRGCGEALILRLTSVEGTRILTTRYREGEDVLAAIQARIAKDEK